ncbi:MAG: ABC transporter permease [Alphaproteobacteria bacterium]|nr:ABC transporter permease [Alphaproteobacteria bacterium]
MSDVAVSSSAAGHGAGFALGDRVSRIGAMLLRHFYVMRSSWIRVFDLMYWPLLQMVIWGFINTFLATQSSWVLRAGGILIGAVLLWDVLVRGQFGMTLSLLEEMWSRNFANLFVAPLRPAEYGVALMGLSVIRSLIGVVPAALIAIPLFHYSIFAMGLPLVAFYAVLMMTGWAAGLLISGMLIRFGLAAESFAWASIFLLAPTCGVYYPVATLPGWLQTISWWLPPTYVFEGMRSVMLQHVFRADLLLTGLALNVVYIALGLAVFLIAFNRARERGQLLQTGE